MTEIVTATASPPMRWSGVLRTRWVVLVAIGLGLVRIPFFLTNHIQEDAYISWRCAVQLADTGIYGFNPGERVSASSSHLYVFMAAGLRAVFGNVFIPAVLVVNTCLLLLGLYLIAGTLAPTGRQRVLIWALAAMTPVGLIVSYGGMETALLVMLIGVAVADLHGREAPSWRSLGPLALLPWVRPDAIAICGILALTFSLRSRRLLLSLVVAPTIGTALLVLFNRVYFGSVLNQTIVAKMVAYHPSHELRDVVARVLGIFFTTNLVFAPLNTKYLIVFAPIFAILTLAILGLSLRRVFRDRGRLAPRLAYVLIVLALPTAYAFGGVVFPWYCWPSSLIATTLVLAYLVDWSVRRSLTRARLVAAGLGTTVLVCAAAQWALAVNWGTQEWLYRASIGKFLKSVARPADTLMLEPAGSIPYFSGLRTWDEIGLVAPVVTAYQRQYGAQWWMRFVRERMPTFLVEEAPFSDPVEVDGKPIPQEDWTWLREHYDFVKHFRYDPGELVASPLLRRIAQLGEACDYYVYRRHDADNVLGGDLKSGHIGTAQNRPTSLHRDACASTPVPRQRARPRRGPSSASSAART